MSDKASHAYKHLQPSVTFRDSCSAESFPILDFAASSFQLKIKEALYIKFEIRLRVIPLSLSPSRVMRKKTARKNGRVFAKSKDYECKCSSIHRYVSSMRNSILKLGH